MKTRLLTLFGPLTITLAAQAQCSISIPQDTVTLYYGYAPLACATLSPVVNGAEPPQLVWSNGSTEATLTVCDTISAWYYVTLVDDTLCTAMDSVYIHVEDVRCGNGLNKVVVCHIPPGNPANAHDICISENGVPAHLAHGCHLGSCGAVGDSIIADVEELQLSVSPNPMAENTFVQLRSAVAQHVVVRVVDAMGRESLTLLDADLAAGENRSLSIATGQLPATLSTFLVMARGDRSCAAHQVIMER